MSNNSLPIDLLPDHSLQLLASAWPQHIDAHKSRAGLLSQINKHLKQHELHPTFTQSTCSQLPVALFGFSVARHQGNLYVYGGRASSDTSSHVASHMYCFEVKQQKWHACKQHLAPQPRRWHSAVVYRDNMLVYGGQCWDTALCEWQPSTSINSYNFNTNTWSELQQAGCCPSTKAKRCAAAAGSTLYVLPCGQVGGPAAAFSMLHCFDLESCCWSMRVCSGPDLPDSQQLILEQLLHQDGSLIAVFSPHPTAAATAVQQQQQHADHHHQQQQQSSPTSPQQQQQLSVYSLSLADNRWHCMPTKGEAPSCRTQSCITLLDPEDLLIVSGGTRGAEAPLLGDLAFLHLPSHTWHHLQLPANCQPARACHAAASIGDGRVCLLGGWHDGWPSPAPSLILQRKYMRRQQQQQQLGPGGSAGGVDDAANNSRPVVNTELRGALLKAASNNAGTAAAGDAAAAAAAADDAGSSGDGAAVAFSAAANGSSSRFNRDMPFCDVTVSSAEGVQFGAHRFLLASQSPVFAAMLGSGMSEAASGTVTLPDVSAAVLEGLLSYLYGGLPSGIPQELVLELFTAADRFLLPGLAAECVLLLKGCLSAENVSLVADLANTHQLQELWESCVVFAAGPEEQLQVFNSAAYAQLWRDSAGVAQAFTTQVVGLTQQLVSHIKQHLPAAPGGPKELCLRGCILPALAGAAGAATAGGGGGAGAGLTGKRQRIE